MSEICICLSENRNFVPRGWLHLTWPHLTGDLSTFYNPRRQCVASFAVLPPRSKLVTSHTFMKRDTTPPQKKWGAFYLLPWSCTFCNISRAYKTTVLGIFLSPTQLKLIYRPTDYLRIAIVDKTFVKNLADPNLSPNPDSEIFSPDFKLDFIRPIAYIWLEAMKNRGKCFRRKIAWVYPQAKHRNID